MTTFLLWIPESKTKKGSNQCRTFNWFIYTGKEEEKPHSRWYLNPGPFKSVVQQWVNASIHHSLTYKNLSSSDTLKKFDRFAEYLGLSLTYRQLDWQKTFLGQKRQKRFFLRGNQTFSWNAKIFPNSIFSRKVLENKHLKGLLGAQNTTFNIEFPILFFCFF